MSDPTEEILSNVRLRPANWNRNELLFQLGQQAGRKMERRRWQKRLCAVTPMVLLLFTWQLWPVQQQQVIEVRTLVQRVEVPVLMFAQNVSLPVQEITKDDGERWQARRMYQIRSDVLHHGVEILPRWAPMPVNTGDAESFRQWLGLSEEDSLSLRVTD